MKANIKQISHVTGFSPATISNALNYKKGVNSKTSQKILKVAEELGYRTEKTVTSIRFVTYRKNGLIIDDSLIFPAMIEGVERQAKELGYETTFCHLNYEDSSFEERLNDILNDVSSPVILLGTEMLEEDYKLFEDYKGYIIVLDGWCEKMCFDGVLINNTDAVYNAMTYLFEKGHREIGYLRGDFRIKSFQYREYGYERALYRYGLKSIPSFMATVGTQFESAYKGMIGYLEANDILPTAFFADNDLIALGAMRAIQEKGIRVPEDVSIVGFDDAKFGAVMSPELTTIHVFKQEMGEVAVRRALDHIKYPGKIVKTKIQVCTQFIERGSVMQLKKNGY